MERAQRLAKPPDCLIVPALADKSPVPALAGRPASPKGNGRKALPESKSTPKLALDSKDSGQDAHSLGPMQDLQPQPAALVAGTF